MPVLAADAKAEQYPPLYPRGGRAHRRRGALPASAKVTQKSPSCLTVSARACQTITSSTRRAGRRRVGVDRITAPYSGAERLRCRSWIFTGSATSRRCAIMPKRVPEPAPRPAVRPGRGARRGPFFLGARERAGATDQGLLSIDASVNRGQTPKKPGSDPFHAISRWLTHTP